MQNHEQFESVLKTALKERSEDILSSDVLFEKIKSGIEKDRSEAIMKKGNFIVSRFSIKKAIALGVCCAFLLAGSVFAADYISKYVSGFITEKEYTSAPSKAEIKADAGFEAKIPETLPGDFKLDQASLAGHIDGSADVKKDDKRKVASAMYRKPGVSQDSFVTLSASNDATETIAAKDSQNVDLGGTAAYYWEYKLHVVPADGKTPNQAVAQDEKDGKLVTVYVSSKKESSKKVSEKYTDIKSLKWVDNNVNYVLADNGCNLSKEELVKMAESIISSK